MLGIDLGPDDDLGGAGFVFEADEEGAFGGLRLLADGAVSYVRCRAASLATWPAKVLRKLPRPVGADSSR